MQNPRRSPEYWLHWRPKDEQPAAPLDLTGFDSFEDSVSSVSLSVPPKWRRCTNGQDPELWQSDLSAWLADACVFHDRAFFSVSCLYICFCEWSLHHHLIACMRGTFETLLEIRGIAICDGLAAGLILKSDLAGFAKQYPVLRPGGQ